MPFTVSEIDSHRDTVLQNCIVTAGKGLGRHCECVAWRRCVCAVRRSPGRAQDPPRSPGRESLCLSTGEYVLGRDDSCTLILEGSGIEDRHAILRFDGDAAWIEPVDGAVRNAHGDEIHDEQELTFGLPVELGNIWISVDREDAPWPDPKSVHPDKG